jgi:hypothetical protein
MHTPESILPWFTAIIYTITSPTFSFLILELVNRGLGVVTTASASVREWEALDQMLAESVWWEMLREVRVDYSCTAPGVGGDSGEDEDEGLGKHFPNCVKKGILVEMRIDYVQYFWDWEPWPTMH